MERNRYEQPLPRGGGWEAGQPRDSGWESNYRLDVLHRWNLESNWNNFVYVTVISVHAHCRTGNRCWRGRHFVAVVVFSTRPQRLGVLRPCVSAVFLCHDSAIHNAVLSILTVGRGPIFDEPHSYV